MVHNGVYVDRACFSQNDSYNILKFGTPCAERLYVCVLVRPGVWEDENA